MARTEDVLETVRLVIIATAAVVSSVVAVLLFRRIPDPRAGSDHRRRRLRTNRPPLPPPHATGPSLYFAVMMTDWLFSVTAAVSQSMDMVMGAGVKVRTVVGATVDALYHVSFLVMLLWGVVLALFVVRTQYWTHNFDATSRPYKRFSARWSWISIWTIGLGCGLLSTARLQANITDSDVTNELANCQRYLFLSVYGVSAGCIIVANVVLCVQKNRLGCRELALDPATITTEQSLSSGSALTSTKTWEMEAQQALRRAHEKLMHYFLVVQVLQFPMMLCYIPGKGVVSYATYEVAKCILFCVPLGDAIMFGLKHLGESQFPHDEDELRDNQTVLQSTSYSSRHAERHRNVVGAGPSAADQS